MLAIASTKDTVPVVLAQRLRKGAANTWISEAEVAEIPFTAVTRTSSR